MIPIGYFLTLKINYHADIRCGNLLYYLPIITIHGTWSCGNNVSGRQKDEDTFWFPPQASHSSYLHSTEIIHILIGQKIFTILTW